ncbi:MAG: hypothetical protein KF691_06200 [Phycisphaeraceae bacterium]|nr:hypothetical protein [Phycisphaeraceae bacterium]
MNHSLVAAVLAGTALSLLSAFAQSQSAAPESKDRPHVKFRIISEHAELTPGTTETLGLVFTMEPHWHVYYKGAPGGGNPPSIEKSDLPKGYSLGEIQWPAPKRFVAPGGIYDSVYEEEVTLLLPMTVPASAKPGDKAKIRLKLGWLECSDVCVFGAGEDTATLAVGAEADKPARSADAGKIEKSRSLMPRPFPTDTASLEFRDGVLAIQVPGAERLEFYPGPECADIKEVWEATLSKSETMTLKFEGANKDQMVADGILGVWLKGAAQPSYYTVKKRSST